VFIFHTVIGVDDNIFVQNKNIDNWSDGGDGVTRGYFPTLWLLFNSIYN